MSTRVLVLGGDTGLGRMVSLVLSKDEHIEVSCTYGYSRDYPASRISSNVQELFLNLNVCPENSINSILAIAKGSDCIINCLSHFQRDPKDIEDYTDKLIRYNVLLPFYVSQVAESLDIAVINISSPDVFYGEGPYKETEKTDSNDPYGISKILGEVKSSHVYNIRAYLVGPDACKSTHRLSNLLDIPDGGISKGYTNKKLSPCTTLALANICRGLVKNDVDIPNIQHLVTGESLSDFDVNVSCLSYFRRESVIPQEDRLTKDQDFTLKTDNAEANRTLWRLGGYISIPSFEDMLNELWHFMKKI